MKNKIINSFLAIVLCGLFVLTYKSYDIDETIDALTGATPSNSVIDSIVGATTGEYEDDDDEDDD